MDEDQDQTKNLMHYRHNSFIDFSFISDKTSSNSCKCQQRKYIFICMGINSV